MSENESTPLCVEVTRGNLVESRHAVALAVSDVEGSIILHRGVLDAPVYPRSAIKPLQALALLETGAAEAFDVSDSEVALACASHNGEPRHVEAVLAWLQRLGCSPSDLECGPQTPACSEDAFALTKAGRSGGPEHNNCSGKHSGFLTVARHLGAPTAGYIGYEHPVQQRVLGILESMTGLDLGRAPRGIDGCGIPVIGIPLGNLALAMARLGAPDDQPEARQAACARVRRAVAAAPFMVAGTGRFCTAVMQVTGPRALVKTGAEGVFCGSLPEQGLGFALKVADGATRAAEAACGYLLRRFGIVSDAEADSLAGQFAPTLVNRVGREVGAIRVAAGGL